MRKIITTTFVTLDGVMQAPGGQEEDTRNGFKYGGWSFKFGSVSGYWDEMMGNTMGGFMNLPFELLLGKFTYDIFAGYWPTAKEDELVAKRFNSTRKYVVSHEPAELSWNNSTLITGDVVSEIKKLKEMDGPDLWVHGSGNLIQTLLENHLIDVMHLWIFPITLGSGQKLFADGAQPENLKLVETKVSKTGVIIATYDLEGILKTSS